MIPRPCMSGLRPIPSPQERKCLGRTPSPSTPVPLPMDEQGAAEWALLDNNSGQDIMAWITRADGSLAGEVGVNDKGIILYRRMLRQQLAWKPVASP